MQKCNGFRASTIRDQLASRKFPPRWSISENSYTCTLAHTKPRYCSHRPILVVELLTTTDRNFVQRRRLHISVDCFPVRIVLCNTRQDSQRTIYLHQPTLQWHAVNRRQFKLHRDSKKTILPELNLTLIGKKVSWNLKFRPNCGTSTMTFYLLPLTRFRILHPV